MSRRHRRGKGHKNDISVRRIDADGNVEIGGINNQRKNNKDKSKHKISKNNKRSKKNNNNTKTNTNSNNKRPECMCVVFVN